MFLSLDDKMDITGKIGNYVRSRLYSDADIDRVEIQVYNDSMTVTTFTRHTFEPEHQTEPEHDTF